MSEYSARASVAPPAYVHVFASAEFKRFEEALGLAGWEAEDLSLAEMVAERRVYFHLSPTAETETRMEVWDMLNAIGVELRSGDHVLFRSEWIGVNRMIAMLDVMGIARAHDAWMAWWRAEVWR